MILIKDQYDLAGVCQLWYYWLKRITQGERRVGDIVKSCKEMIFALQKGEYDSVLTQLYAPSGNESELTAARQRAMNLVETFGRVFAPSEQMSVGLFSAPGRTEIGGNHTDHQHGHVLCAGVDLDTLACAAPNGTNVIRIQSEGYPTLAVELNDLLPRAEEEGTSAALVRGVAAKLTQMGYTIGGFDACMTSDVLSGSGLSSSAAYEVLIGIILNRLFCGGQLDAIEIAKIGQYAENVYFGKPCGLMDQMASSVGGVVSIDFTDTAKPVVERVEYDFLQAGHALCIIDTGSCHADLTEDYAEIPREMGAVAAYFGKAHLRQVSREQFEESIGSLRRVYGDRAVLRAMHFYDDDARAVQEAECLRKGDFDGFLALVNESGLSSALLLQNIYTCNEPKQQAVSLALAVGRRLLNGTGAIRVHGGGFAGTIQAFVPTDRLETFRAGMEQLLGEGSCFVLGIRPVGGCVITD